MRSVSIVGGGVAGLSLAIGLRKKGVDTVLHEVQTYPRHRVCGEFICGVNRETLSRLGVEDIICRGTVCREVGWFHNAKCVFRDRLPADAFGISRYRMDQAMSQRFVELGGALDVGTRIQRKDTNSPEGYVWATGRFLDKQSDWVGLKVHARDIKMSGDLEIHLGESAYVGLSRVEDSWINICGLLKRAEIGSGGLSGFFKSLESVGLSYLVSRLKKGEIREGSLKGVSHINFETPNHTDAFVLGDHLVAIPPFTGNGMSMAFEAAEMALPFLVQYADAKLAWEEATALYHQQVQSRFKKRLRTARTLHPWVFHSRGQQLLLWLARRNLLPFSALFKLTHS